MQLRRVKLLRQGNTYFCATEATMPAESAGIVTSTDQTNQRLPDRLVSESRNVRRGRRHGEPAGALGSDLVHRSRARSNDVPRLVEEFDVEDVVLLGGRA